MVCEVNMAGCGCKRCIAEEACFHVCSWMTWKHKIYCGTCIENCNWKPRSEAKAATHFHSQTREQMCRNVINSVREMTKLERRQQSSQTASLASSASSTNSLNSLHIDEIRALLRMVEDLTTRVAALEDMKWFKRNLDARLDNFENKLAFCMDNIEMLQIDKDDQVEFVEVSDHSQGAS